MRFAVPRSRRSWSCAAVSLAAALLVGCGGDDAKTTAAPVDGARVAVVMFEDNHVDEKGWLPDAAKGGGTATNAHGETNPSMGNYLAMISGSTQGVSDDDIQHGPFMARTLAGQLDAAAVSWKAYFNAMPGPCWDVEGEHDEYGKYAKRHNPFLFFSEIIGDEKHCAAHVVPGRQLTADMAAGKLPQLIWLTPDLCQQAHDCDVEAASAWMAQALPPLI